MRQAIAEAEVGDHVLGDDPTADALERRAAELLGKERALFFPSGIMANQTALLVQTRPGTEVVLDVGAHILNYEEGAAPAWSGVQLRGVPPGADGLPDPDSVAAAVRTGSRYLPEASLLCLENTHNGAGGRILPVERMAVLTAMARAHDIPIHLDGARLPNAAVATGRDMRDWASLVDTVMVSLSKGLGAPVGSVLAGSDRVIEAAWRVRRRLGGGMRQAGILAAAGLYALEHNFERLAEDHRRARTLATAASRVSGLHVAAPESNIVMIDLPPELGGAEGILAALAKLGVRMTSFGPHRLRAVTHLDVDDAGIERAAQALAQACARAP